MEWRQQTSLSCAEAFDEAQRWIEEVTGKSFDCSNFRAALENGVLLCDLINKLKPGIIKRLNRLSTPIAGLDNVSVFLKACGKLGLNESQLFHPGDLQDLSTRVTLKRDEGSRRLKNVLITIYWLGRKANQDLYYKGPQLNFKSFEGLLGLALSRALDDTQDKEEIQRKRSSYKRQSSVDSVDSPDAKATTTSSEGCCSDAEAEQVFKMETSQTSAHSSRGHLPTPLQKAKQARGEKGCTSPMARPGQILYQERPVQVNPGWIWSKSLTEIPMVYPVHNMADENTILHEPQDPGTTQFKRKNSVTKETEAQWHEDLNKWKSRRRSSKTEGLRTSQDREHVIHQMTNGAKTTFQKTIVQGGPMIRDQPSQHTHNPTSNPYSTSSPTKSSRASLRPHPRALLARSYTTDMPTNSPSYCPQTSGQIQGPTVGTMPEPITDILDKDNHMASLASVGTAATTPSMEHPFSSQTNVKNVPATSHSMAREHFTCSSVLPKEITKLNAAAEELTLDNHREIDVMNDPSKTIHSEKQELTMEPINGQGLEKFLSRAGTWSGSASLPRGYRRSDGSSRLSVARPFGTTPSRVSSLQRLCNVDDNQLNWLSNNDKEVSPPVTLLKRQTATAHLKGHAPVMQTAHGTEQKNCAILSSVIQTIGYRPQTPVLPQLCTAHVPQVCSSTLVKESSAPVNVDHSDMRVCLTLRPNSRPDFGFQTHWDDTGARVKSIQPGSPAEFCHLFINDEIIAVDGISVTHLNLKKWKNKMTSALQTGSLTMDIRRYGNRDWSTSEASLYKQPGQNRTTLDLTSAVPLVIGRPDHHAGTNTTVMALSKFNGQPNNGNFCQNMEEHTDHPRRAISKGGSESAISDLQVPSLSPSSGSWSWDREEERRRQEKWQEEQERLLQEKYQRDQERLESEWRKAQQDASSDKKDELKMVSSDENHQRMCLRLNGMTNGTQDEPSPATNDVKSMEISPHEAKEMQQEKPSDDWVKSMSSPALTSPQKQMRGTSDQRKRKSQTVSKAEQDRQQILEEMKKRTQLLTDNSWIRQRSASFYKEPIMPGVPVKRVQTLIGLEQTKRQVSGLNCYSNRVRLRVSVLYETQMATKYESMDNLESWRHSPVTSMTFTYPRPQSAAAGYCGSTRTSSTRHSTGSMPPQRHRTEPGRRTCCVCEGVLDSGAAMVIEALGLNFHLACFQCKGCCRDLRGREAGVQVRIHNHRPYCETCYFHLKFAGSALL